MFIPTILPAQFEIAFLGHLTGAKQHKGLFLCHNNPACLAEIANTMTTIATMMDMPDATVKDGPCAVIRQPPQIAWDKTPPAFHRR